MIRKANGHYFEEEVPIYCNRCRREIPARQLACRFCCHVQQPAPRVRLDKPKPDAPGGLFDGVPPTKL